MTDPEVYLANREVTDLKESIHTHHNDDIKMVVDSPSLVGRTDEGRGLAQKITVAAPLTLAGQQLSIDQSALEGQIADLNARVGALEGALSAVMALLWALTTTRSASAA
jgi:hypothetical protein